MLEYRIEYYEFNEDNSNIKESTIKGKSQQDIQEKLNAFQNKHYILSLQIVRYP